MLKAYIKGDFKNLLEFRVWVRESIKNLKDSNSSQFEKQFSDARVRRDLQDSDWFGEGTTLEELKRGITEYKKPELISQIFDKVDSQVSTVTRNMIKTNKLRYNSSGLGAFIFDRAAIGLYRLKEFYSPLHKKVFDQAEVKSTKRGHKLINDNSPIVERWETKSDGKPKVRTSNKNVFAWFPPKKKEKRAVELFVGCGGHGGVSAEAFLYSGISAIIVAQLLEKAGIPTKITIGVGSSPDGFEKKVYAALIPVKNYDERLDINLLALLSSDPRFFRYEGLQSYPCLYQEFGDTVPEGFGIGLGHLTLMQSIEQTGYAQRAKLAPNRYYFGRIFNEQDALDHINKTVKNLSEKLNEG